MPKIRETAIITGASSGIGEAFADKLAAKGHNLILIAKDKHNLVAVAKRITNKYKINVKSITTDLSNREEFFKLENKLKKVNASFLINNAGFGQESDFIGSSPKQIQTILDVHVTATTRLSRLVLPSMMKRNKGTIINVGSIGAFLRNKKNSAMYTATKTYVVVFSETLQQEIWNHRKNVKVQALCPGFTKTNFHKSLIASQSIDIKRIPNFMWYSADDVASKSLAALKNKSVIYIPGTLNKCTAFMLRNDSLSWIANKTMEHNK